MAKENFTYKHLAERLKFYVEEDFVYRINEDPSLHRKGYIGRVLNNSVRNIRYGRTVLCDDKDDYG